MPFLIDRQRALWTQDIVAIVKSRQRRIRSRVILRDNSLYHTLTRPQMFLKRTQPQEGAFIQIGTGRRRTA